MALSFGWQTNTVLKSHTVSILCGPTASGKSGLALALAKTLPIDIINADSTQIYEGLRILTARPTTEDEQAAPHYLYGSIPPEQAFSATKWRAAALKQVYASLHKHRLPLLVGGTGFYIKTLLEGLAPIPETPTEFRREAESLYDSYGGLKFHEKLAQCDPESAANLHPNDRQRLVRAWEVLEHTGTPLSVWKTMPKIRPPDELSFKTIVLLPDREWLYSRCDTRFDMMIDAGAIDEVREFRKRSIKPNLPVNKVIGLRELGSVLERQLTLEEASEQAKQATRNYAKRQLTWFRGQTLNTPRGTVNAVEIDENSEIVSLLNDLSTFFWEEKSGASDGT